MHNYRTFQNIIVHHYAKKYGVPYVLQAHGSLPRIMAKQRLKWIYDVFFGYRLLRDASRVIALSGVEADQYRSVGVPEERIEVIPNGIDLSEYADLPPKGSFKKKIGIDNDKKMILYLGRIHKTKGIDFLVRAYACLLKSMKDNNAVLVVAGSDDGYLAEAKRLAASLKIADKVVFTGMLSEKEKVGAYVDSSIVVNVEPRNVFGLVPLEAAACSTPVIVSKSNAVSDIIDRGRFGFSVNYGDINELARIMGKMLDNEVLLREMGQNGRWFVSKNFSWNRIITSFEKVYKEVIEN
jgi:glycosyltransferase involved in cell wall biosynthesis